MNFPERNFDHLKIKNEKLENAFYILLSNGLFWDFKLNLLRQDSKYFVFKVTILKKKARHIIERLRWIEKEQE